ncbi:MAG: DUF2069 domain-containing protein [Gammaproteobacteria bacterium]|nr:DUF2069 domain-containing protein [Gammaproteobacteria bacterium]
MIRLARWCTLLGYVSLLCTIVIWNGLVSPPVQLSTLLVLLILVTPLLFPAHGLLLGKPYTHAWSGFLALGYFMLGVSSIVIEAERNYGLFMSISSLVFFSGGIFFARHQSRWLRAQTIGHAGDPS